MLPFLDYSSLVAPFYDHLFAFLDPGRLRELLQLDGAGRVMDLGGGTGRVAQTLQSIVDEIVVLDESAGMLRQARRKGLPAESGEAERLPFANGAFTRILSEPISARMVDTNALTAFTSDGAQVAVLLESQDVTALLLCLEPGQGVGPCRMDCAVMYYVIEGRGRLRMEDELDASSLDAGALTVVPAGAVRSIVAGERMRVLAVQNHPVEGRNL